MSQARPEHVELQLGFTVPATLELEGQLADRDLAVVIDQVEEDLEAVGLHLRDAVQEQPT